MTYRELRNFTEMLRALGYPRLVSIENFRTPNFNLVAEILTWLLKKYDPECDIPDSTDTESDRVIFIKTASLFMVQKARIKINPKKLYQSDGYAVQEMLKVASILYNAVQQNQNNVNDEEDNDTNNVVHLSNNINTKLNELRLSRQFASEIIDRGANLYELLNKEVDLKEQRTAALARSLELSDVEKSLRASVKAVDEEIKQIVYNLDHIAADESTLEAKMEKKRTDLDRQQKRLVQLQSVRPAYMDEYEKLENELQSLYSAYVVKFRNLSYLEYALSEFDKAEMERTTEAEKSLRRIAEKMREEERQRSAVHLDLAISDDNRKDFSPDESPRQKPILDTAPKVYGSMTGAGISDEEDEGDSLLSDEDDDEELIGDGDKHQRSDRPKGGVVRRQKSDDLSDTSGFGTGKDRDHPPPPAGDSDDDF